MKRRGYLAAIVVLLAAGCIEDNASSGGGDADGGGADKGMTADATGVDRADGDGAGLGGIDAAGADALDGIEHLGQNKDRVHGLVWIGTVATRAGERNVERIFIGRGKTGCDFDLAGRQIAGYVQRNGAVDIL